MVRLMVETVALHLAMCLNRDLCEQVDRAEQPQQRSVASPSGGSALRSGYSRPTIMLGGRHATYKRALARAASCPKNGDQPKSPLAQLAA